MFGRLRWFKTIARIESRSVLANPWRTLLVVALIGIPVAAIVAGNNLLFVTRATPVERSVKAMGVADLRIETWRTADELTASLPQDCEVEPFASGREPLVLNGLRLSVVAKHLDLDGLASGMVQLVEGVAPSKHGEVAVTRPLLKTGNLSIGDSFETPSGEAVIVGVIEDVEDLGQMGLLYPLVDGTCPEPSGYLVKLPQNLNLETALENLTEEDHVIARSTAANEVPQDAALVFIIGGFALAEAAMIVAAAFIVGVRRRQRETGLIASAGATRFQVMTSVLVFATLASLIAVVSALGLGLLVSWIVHPYLDQWNGRRNGAFEICWGTHLIALLMGVFTAVASALVPAISASRMPIKEALSSRRPVPGLPVRSLSLGVIVLITAVAVVVKAKPLALAIGWNAEASTLLVMLGSVLGVLGIGICSPWILGVLAKCSNWLPLSWRLAVRETGRFRTRNGPIIASIVAGMALSVMFATIYKSVLSLDHDVTQMFAEDQILVTGPAAVPASNKIIEDFDGQAPSASISKVTLRGRPIAVYDESNPEQILQIAVASKSLLATLGIAGDDEAIQTALDRGALLSLAGEVGPEVSLRPLGSERVLATPEVVSVDAKRIGPIGYLISSTAMAKHNWSSRDGIMGREMETRLVRIGSNVDETLLSKVAAVAAKFPATTVTAQCEFKTDRSQLLSFFLVSLLSGLVVIAIATSLASAESQSDQRILATVGAPPSVSRHQSAARAAFLALLGCVLAIPAGMLPAWGIIDAIARLEFTIPWFEVLIVAAGLPLAAYALTYLGTRLTPARM